MAKQFSLTSEHYSDFLQGLKERIRTAQIQAALAVNRELILLYWQIGQEILTRQREQGWGSRVIDQLAKDLQKEFPEMKGFSTRNLKYMRAFAEAYPSEAIVQEVLAQITWYHNIALLEKLKSNEERTWYAQQTIVHGWSRNILVMQIESGLHRRQGGAITNFQRTLPKPQSDLAQQIIKDPYNFDFLSLGKDAQERELERALVDHIRNFLIELGLGFAFLGSQYPIEVDGKDYRLDLLFYHIKLRCFIVIDLKMGEFLPEYSGKMNFYVSAVDDLLRHPSDQPTVGIILCKSKSKTTAEYALRNVNTPIGVSTYQMSEDLPGDLRESLPSVEQLEMKLEAIVSELGNSTIQE